MFRDSMLNIHMQHLKKMSIFGFFKTIGIYVVQKSMTLIFKLQRLGVLHIVVERSELFGILMKF